MAKTSKRHCELRNNRMVVERMLAELAKVTTVEDGAQALRAFMERPFDVVLMDVQMPVMDGLSAVRAIRSHEGVVKAVPTPIIMLTANPLPEHVAASLNAGADPHLCKRGTLASLVGAQPLSKHIFDTSPGLTTTNRLRSELVLFRRGFDGSSVDQHHTV